MKKILLSLLIVCSLLTTGAMPHERLDDPLLTFIQLAENNQLLITSWEVTLKETILPSIFNDIVNSEQNSHLVTSKENENSIIYILGSTGKTIGLQLEQRFIIAKNNPEQIERIAVLKGTKWNEEIQTEYEQMRKELLNSFSSKNRITFTCLDVVQGDRIEHRAIIEQFSKGLQLVHMEEQDDPLEMSKLKKMIYGYTPLWNEKFVIEGIPYNIQIATTELESGELAYTIGTPILINEY